MPIKQRPSPAKYPGKAARERLLHLAMLAAGLHWREVYFAEMHPERLLGSR